MQKRFFLPLLLLFIGITAHAQQDSTTKHYSNSQLDQYVGKWEYTSGSDQFTITLAKEKRYVEGSDSIYVDVLEGYHSWQTPALSTSSETIGKSQSSMGNSSPSLYAGGAGPSLPDGKIGIRVKNILTNEIHAATLSLVRGSLGNEFLEWQLTVTPGVRVNTPYSSTLGLPQEITFTKVASSAPLPAKKE